MRKFKRREADRHTQSAPKRCPRKSQRYRDDGLPCEPLPAETVQRRTNQRQDWDQPEIEVWRHSLSRFTRSTFRVSRVRYTAMMMANPTAASAAATTITKKTKTCPLKACHCAANATNERFTPFSISSIDMKMVIMLRLIRNPSTPQANKMPLSTR